MDRRSFMGKLTAALGLAAVAPSVLQAIEPSPLVPAAPLVGNWLTRCANHATPNPAVFAEQVLRVKLQPWQKAQLVAAHDRRLARLAP